MDDGCQGDAFLSFGGGWRGTLSVPFYSVQEYVWIKLHYAKNVEHTGEFK